MKVKLIVIIYFLFTTILMSFQEVNNGCSIYKRNPDAIWSIVIPAYRNGFGNTSIGEEGIWGYSWIAQSMAECRLHAFSGCCVLASITIPNDVASIGPASFMLCIGLNKVTISSNVSSIGTHAFYLCTGLTNVTMLGVIPPSIDSSVFLSTSPSMKIHVPTADAVKIYQTAPGWSIYFMQIVYP